MKWISRSNIFQNKLDQYYQAVVLPRLWNLQPFILRLSLSLTLMSAYEQKHTNNIKILITIKKEDLSYY